LHHMCHKFRSAGHVWVCDVPWDSMQC